MFPIFCAVLFGMIDYGWYFYERFSLAAAVRDGLRVGVTVSPSAASPNDYSTLALARATADLTASGMTVPIGTFTLSTSLTAASTPLKTLTMTGSHAFTPLVNFVALPTAGMTYSMTMIFEQQQ